MVAKISTGGNMFGALAYNQNKVDSEEAKVLFSNRMLLSEDGNFSIGECMRSFEMQMPVQLSTKKPILHISINPHPEDVLTDRQFSDIAKEYMRKLGYGDQPYLVYKHTDIDRHHIHIVGLRVDENGRPLNDRFEHRRSKQITRELEKKYGLHPAERKERAERPELKKVDYAAGSRATTCPTPTLPTAWSTPARTITSPPRAGSRLPPPRMWPTPAVTCAARRAPSLRP